MRIEVRPHTAGRWLVVGGFGCSFNRLRSGLESCRYYPHPRPTFGCAATAASREVLDALEAEGVEVVWIAAKPEAPRRVETVAKADVVYKTEPLYPQQLDEVRRSVALPAFMFAWGPGLGKTKAFIDTAATNFVAGNIDRAVYISLRGPHRELVLDQLPLHCPVEFKAMAVSASSLTKRTLVEFDDLSAYPGLKFLSLNVDGVRSPKLLRLVEQFCDGGRTLLAVDESHRIKTPGSDRTMKITALGRRPSVVMRRTLTGTPQTRGQQDLFAQYRFLDENIIGCRTFTAFCAQYVVKGGYENRVIVGYKNLDRLRAKIANYTSVLTKEQVMPWLPEKRFLVVRGEMTKEQATVYMDVWQRMKRKDYDPLGVDPDGIKNQLHGIGLLRRISGGFDRHGEYLGSGKLDALVNLLEQMEGRVVVWAVHTREIDLIAQAARDLDREVLVYDGRVTKDDDRDELRARYKASKDCVFIGNPAAGGTGLNLEGATEVIYYSNGFRAEDRWQSIERTHRATTTEKVTYRDLVVSKVCERLRLDSDRKKAVADMTMSELDALIDDLAL